MTTHQAAFNPRTTFETLKARFPEALVGFEVGAFIEFFYEDAITVSGTVGIALADRGKHLDQSIPMAGFPLCQRDHFVARLAASGLAVHVEANPYAGEHASDVESVDLATLPMEGRLGIEAQLEAWDRQRLRAAALHERLAERGLAEEAEQLGVRHMHGNADSKAASLDPLESIVARLDLGATPDLLAALRSSAGMDAALGLLNQVIAPYGAAAFGERIAVAVICKADDDGDDFAISGENGRDVIEAIESAEESLRNRLELVEDALRRLRAAGVGEEGPLN